MKFLKNLAPTKSGRTDRGYISMPMDDCKSQSTYETAEASDSDSASPQKQNLRIPLHAMNTENQQNRRTPTRKSTPHSPDQVNEVGKHRTPLRKIQRQPQRTPNKTTEVKRTNSLFCETKKQLPVPGNWYFSSNHILINQERARRQTPPLVRSSELDEEARKQAEQMAKKATLLYTKQSRLSERLSVPFKHFAENVATGKSVRSVHAKFMEDAGIEKANMLNPMFKNMGVGTAKGPEEELYICQIFIA